MNNEQKKKSISDNLPIDNTTLSKVRRPRMANEAIKLLEDGIDVEIQNDKVFELLRYIDKAKRNFKYSCKVNEATQGWTVLHRYS